MFHYICELFHYIDKLFQNIYSNIKFILYVYYTSLPDLLYQQATSAGNTAFAGIGLGLIQCKKTFWISKIGILIMFYYKYFKNLNFVLFYFGSFIFLCMLINSLIKTTKLIKNLKLL